MEYHSKISKRHSISNSDLINVSLRGTSNLKRYAHYSSSGNLNTGCLNGNAIGKEDITILAGRARRKEKPTANFGCDREQDIVNSDNRNHERSLTVNATVEKDNRNLKVSSDLNLQEAKSLKKYSKSFKLSLRKRESVNTGHHTSGGTEFEQNGASSISEQRIINCSTRLEKTLTKDNLGAEGMDKNYIDPSESTALSHVSKTYQASTHPASLELNQANEPVVEEDGRINYYPNCDPTVWVRSCTHPVDEPIHGIKFGVIPKWIKGTLIRNGPGRTQVGDDTYNHIFDGSALLHRFSFNDGNVTYKNKFLESSSYLRDSNAQRIMVSYFGTKAHPDPCKTIFQNLASMFSFEEHFTDNAQISVYPYGDGLYALTEAPFVFRLDPSTLGTKEKINMMKYLTIFSHTAHPHVSNNGNVYNIGQGVGLTGPVYYICEFPNGNSLHSPFEEARIIGSMKARWVFHPSYMHSFALTDNYFVIIEQPLVVSTAKVLRGILRLEPMAEALQWWDKESKFHVMHRLTGKVHHITYETEAFFFLHTINAFEDKDHIVIDIAAYKDAKILDCMYVEALKNAAYNPSYAAMFRGRPKRWVLPLKTRKDVQIDENLITLSDTNCCAKWISKNTIYVQSELLADIGCEVPRINYEKYNGKKYQYFYAICSDVDHHIPGTLIKVDVMNKTHLEWGKDNVYPSEPVFIPSPNSEKEDDGVILSSLLRCKGLDNQICLLVLDASTFQEKGRVEFQCEGPVPKCLHGWFVPQKTLTGKKFTNQATETESETENDPDSEDYEK